MKKLIPIFFLALMPAVAFAAGGHGGVKLEHVEINLKDQAALQNGARIFVNYCLSCHSAAYMRYNRMGSDLGISDELIKENLLFAADKVGDQMKAVMPPEDAKDWFGVAPPDLTLVTRSRGADWFYTYMRSFYRDDKATHGWNNLVFPNVAMPFVLYEWQGDQRAVFRTEKRSMMVEHEGKKIKKEIEEQVFDHFELEKSGTMTGEEYDRAMRDLTNFMVYLAEPAKLTRTRVGVYVIIFLVIFLVVAYLLKREYWKDVH